MIQQNLQIVCFCRLLSASCCLSCICALYSCLYPTLLFTTEMPSALIDLSKLSEVFHSALPHVFTAALHRFNLGRFNKHTVHSLIQAINKILNGSSEQLSTHPICPLHFTVSHCKLLSDSTQICARISAKAFFTHGCHQGQRQEPQVCGTCCFFRIHKLSSIGLHQLVLLLRDSCRQAFISLLVPRHLENILIILLFYFPWVLNLLISYLSCLICGQLPGSESVRALWTVGKAADPNLSLGETLCQM